MTMLGIEDIASYIPEQRISNYSKKSKFEIDDAFIDDKIGVKAVSVKSKDDKTSDLCVRAFNRLQEKISMEKARIQTAIVITQNPDARIPHTSAIVQGKLDLSENCACFDISLGCSGYVYGLSIVHSFMRENGFTKGLLFTADPYSGIVDPEDKNTSLLFGDAATVTLVGDRPLYQPGHFTFGTMGKEYQNLYCETDKLVMNGRGIFSFSAKFVPSDIMSLLQKKQLDISQIDKFIFHQGSKYMVDTIASRLKLPKDRVVYDAYDYGNTVSSSIPILLEKEIAKTENRNIVICGFGAGLSWASGLLQRTEGV